MKTSASRISIAVALSASLLLAVSCKKKEKETTTNPATTTTTTDNEQTTATDNNLAENITNDIESMGSQVSDNGSLSTFRTNGEEAVTGVNALASSPCATVSGFGTGVITVDFGTTGCTGTDGRVRTGKLIFTLSSPSTSHYRNPGFSMSVTSQNYMVDSVHVNIINKTITNTTPSTIPPTGTPTVNLTWAISANITITKPNNTTFTWTCSRTKELTNTNDPNCYHGQAQAIDWGKAIIKLNGTSSGTNTHNESFTATITNLVRNFQCSPIALRPNYHPFISGTIAYTPGSRPQRLVDFGNGTCDNIATITINGQTYTIVLI